MPRPPSFPPTHAVSGQLLGMRSKVCYTSLIADAVFIYQSVLTSPRTDCCRQATINQFKLKSDGYWTGRAGCCIGLQHPSFIGVPFWHWTTLGSLSGMQSAFLIWKIEKHLSILSHQFPCLSLPLSVCLVVSLRPACFASFLPHTHTHTDIPGCPCCCLCLHKIALVCNPSRPIASYFSLSLALKLGVHPQIT